MIVLRIPVKSNGTNLLERVITMRPHFGNIENVEPVLISISNRHDLYVPRPAREVSFSNFTIKIMSGPLRVLLTLLGSLFSSEVLDSLVSLVVRLNVDSFTFIVDPLECVAGIAVHATVAVGGTTVAHQDSYLME